MFQKGVVIGKAPAHFFNCSSSWPSQAALFLLLSPGTDEAFFSNVGMSRTRNLRNGPAQYSTLHYQLPYMETHMLLCKYIKQMKFSGVVETNW